MFLCLISALIVFLIYIIKRKKYEKTEYFQQTHNPLRKVRRDKGLLGEYYIYLYAACGMINSTI